MVAWRANRPTVARWARSLPSRPSGTANRPSGTADRPSGTTRRPPRTRSRLSRTPLEIDRTRPRRTGPPRPIDRPHSAALAQPAAGGLETVARARVGVIDPLEDRPGRCRCDASTLPGPAARHRTGFIPRHENVRNHLPVARRRRRREARADRGGLRADSVLRQPAEGRPRPGDASSGLAAPVGRGSAAEFRGRTSARCRSRAPTSGFRRRASPAPVRGRYPAPRRSPSVGRPRDAVPSTRRQGARVLRALDAPAPRVALSRGPGTDTASVPSIPSPGRERRRTTPFTDADPANRSARPVFAEATRGLARRSSPAGPRFTVRTR